MTFIKERIAEMSTKLLEFPEIFQNAGTQINASCDAVFITFILSSLLFFLFLLLLPPPPFLFSLFLSIFFPSSITFSLLLYFHLMYLLKSIRSIRQLIFQNSFRQIPQMQPFHLRLLMSHILRMNFNQQNNQQSKLKKVTLDRKQTKRKRQKYMACLL